MILGQTMKIFLWELGASRGDWLHFSANTVPVEDLLEEIVLLSLQCSRLVGSGVVQM